MNQPPDPGKDGVVTLIKRDRLTFIDAQRKHEICLLTFENRPSSKWAQLERDFVILFHTETTRVKSPGIQDLIKGTLH